MAETSVQESDKKLFNTIAKKYAEKDFAESSMIARRHQILSAMEPALTSAKRIGTIVDVGCGIGASATYLRGHFKKYIGIDHSYKLIDIAKTWNTAKDVNFLSADIKSVGSEKVGDRTADVILIVGALHHMTELNRVMKSLRRIAKPDAFLVAIEPQRTNPLVQLMRWARGKLDSSYSQHQTYFSPAELERLLVSNGIEVLDMRYQGYFVPPFAQFVLKPQAVSVPLCKIAIYLDSLIESYTPDLIRQFSWDLIVEGRFL